MLGRSGGPSQTRQLQVRRGVEPHRTHDERSPDHRNGHVLQLIRGVLTALLRSRRVSACLVAAVRLRLLPVKVLCGALSVMVAIEWRSRRSTTTTATTRPGGSWTDVHGSTGNLGVISSTASTPAVGSGRLGWTVLAGKLSGYTGRGWCTCRRSTARPSTRRCGSRSVETRHPRLPPHLGHGAADRPGHGRVSWPSA